MHFLYSSDLCYFFEWKKNHMLKLGCNPPRIKIDVIGKSINITVLTQIFFIYKMFFSKIGMIITCYGLLAQLEYVF